MRDEQRDEYIKKIVDACPPFTPEQRDKLAILLRPSEKTEQRLLVSDPLDIP